MTTKAIITPFIPFMDTRGAALQNGFVYIGATGYIAEASPISVYWDRALTQPAAQPLRTLNGYIVRNGTPANVFFGINGETDYSITAKNSQSVTLFNVLSALAAGFIDQDTTEPVTSGASSGNHLQNTNFENNTAQLEMPAVVRPGDAFYDKFVAGASGLTASIASVNGINTVTISAGSIIQNVIAGVIGSFVLTWEGTAQARINGGSYKASPIYVTAGSTVAVIACEWETGTVSKINLNYNTEAETWIPGINYYLFQQEPKNNLVYNGDMLINQSEVGLVTLTSGHPVDGFFVVFPAGLLGVGQAQQISYGVQLSLAGRYVDKHLHISTNAASPAFSADDFLFFMQRIEGYRLREIISQPCCIRFFARAKTPGVYSLVFRNADATKSYVIEYNIPTADTWIRIEKNITSMQFDSVSNNVNGSGIALLFTVDSGTIYKTSTLNTWLTGNYIASSNQAHGATVANDGLRITGVEFCKGTLETAKVLHRSYDEELDICKRYYREYKDLFMCGYGAAADLFSIDIPISPEMRAAPAVSYANIAYTNASGLTALNAKTNHVAHYASVTALGHSRCDFDVILDARL